MATLRLYQQGGIFCELEDYSIVKNLIFDVLAETPNAELSPFEKLYVVHAVGFEVHQGYLADAHMQCGCFAEARQYYLTPEHPRKLGDICWCEGRLEEAETYYSKPKSEAQFYRTEPDHDRLIKLAFFRDDWAKVIERFCAASFSRGFLAGQVCIGRSHTTASPYLEMLACALSRADMVAPSQALDHLKHGFGISAEDWVVLTQKIRAEEPKVIAKLRKRCRPRIGAAVNRTVEAARSMGDTARARSVADYIRNADASLETAQSALERFGSTGADADLETFIEFVTGSGVESISRSFLFAAFGHDSYPKSSIPASRLIRLLSRHPIMNRRHLGTLLDLRFHNSSPITGDELLAGVFQNLGTELGMRKNDERPLASVAELGSVREWARVRLDEWLGGRGLGRADEVAENWRGGVATPKPGGLFPNVIRAVASPRDTAEWTKFTDAATRWLRIQWAREIGSSPWVSENQLFQLVRRQLKGIDVIQHARPTWLEPQHLDIYIPAVDLAVEYMGRQHFEPLDFFGGESAYLELVQRDQKKAQLCQRYGLELIYVRHDENLASRSKEVIAYALSKAKARGLIR
jgi:hypothetical protein